MTSDRYWEAMQEKNPKLKLDPKVELTLTVEKFKQAVTQAFELGVKQGTDASKRITDIFGRGFKP